MHTLSYLILKITKIGVSAFYTWQVIQLTFWHCREMRRAMWKWPRPSRRRCQKDTPLVSGWLLLGQKRNGLQTNSARLLLSGWPQPRQKWATSRHTHTSNIPHWVTISRKPTIRQHSLGLKFSRLLNANVSGKKSLHTHLCSGMNECIRVLVTTNRGKGKDKREKEGVNRAEKGSQRDPKQNARVTNLVGLLQ